MTQAMTQAQFDELIYIISLIDLERDFLNASILGTEAHLKGDYCLNDHT
jgi:hypothetical protein